MKGVWHRIVDDLEDLECACGILDLQAREMLALYAAFDAWCLMHDRP